MSRIAWRECLAFAAAVLLTALPDLAGIRGTGSDALHVVGPLAAMVAVMALWGVLRPLRWLNVPLGAAAVLSAFLFDLGQTAAIASIGAGLAIAIASATDRPDPHFRGRWRALFGRED